MISAAMKGEPAWGPGVWEISVSAIKEIVFGARDSNVLQSQVVALAKKHTPDVALKKIVLHAQTFELLTEDLDAIPEAGHMKGFVLDPNSNWLGTRELPEE